MNVRTVRDLLPRLPVPDLLRHVQIRDDRPCAVCGRAGWRLHLPCWPGRSS